MNDIIIRNECIPRSWNELDNEQQRAIERLIRLIKTYLNQANIPLKGFPTDFPLRTKYQSNLVFLDGDRGTGKSTVIYSLIQAIISSSEDFFPQDHENNASHLELRHLLKDLRHRNVIFLESLDPELMPSPANLISALMVRIEETFKRYCFKETQALPHERLLFPENHTDDTWSNFSRLMRAVSIGWSTNLNGRKSTDPDTYAEEVLKTERSRLKIKDFDHDLSALAQEIGKINRTQPPLFVLPVDDADLTPLYCLELFHMIRRISSPNLLFLVAGNHDNLEKLFELKYAAELSDISGPNMTGNIYRDDSHKSYISSLSQSIGHAAIQKLIPRGEQYIQLKNLTVKEGIHFYIDNQGKRIKHPTDSIYGILHTISDTLSTSPPLTDLLFFEKSFENQEGVPSFNNPELWSQITDLFANTVRKTYDFWLELSLLRNDLKLSNNTDRFIAYVEHEFLRKLETTPQKDIQELSGKGSIAGLRFTLEPVIQNHHTHVNVENSPSFQINGVKYFKIYIHNPDTQKEILLNQEQAAWYLFYRKINQTTNRYSSVLNLWKGTDNWVRSTANSSTHLLEWPSLPWENFHDLEKFRAYWQAFLSYQPMNNPNTHEQDILDSYVYVWSRGLIEICSGKKISLSNNIFQSKSRSYHTVKSSLEKQNPYYLNLLQSLLIVHSPERGTSPNLRSKFLKKFGKYFKHNNLQKANGIQDVFERVISFRARGIIGATSKDTLPHFKDARQRIDDFLIMHCHLELDLLSIVQLFFNITSLWSESSLNTDLDKYGFTQSRKYAMLNMFPNQPQFWGNSANFQDEIVAKYLSIKNKFNKLKTSGDYGSDVSIRLYLDFIAFLRDVHSWHYIEESQMEEEDKQNFISLMKKTIKIVEDYLSEQTKKNDTYDTYESFTEEEAITNQRTDLLKATYSSFKKPLSFKNVLLYAANLVRPSEKEYSNDFDLLVEQIRSLGTDVFKGLPPL